MQDAATESYIATDLAAILANEGDAAKRRACRT